MSFALRSGMWIGLVGLLGWLGLAVAPAHADLAPPRPAAVLIRLELDEKAKAPRVIVPPGALQGARNDAGGDARPDVENVQLDLDNAERIVADTPATEVPNHQTLMIGLALSLSIALGGLWLMRKPRFSTWPASRLGVVVAVGASLTLGALVWANGVPPMRRPPNLPNAPDGGPKLLLAVPGEVVLARGNAVQVVLDRATFAKLAALANAKPPAPAVPPQGK